MGGDLKAEYFYGEEKASKFKNAEAKCVINFEDSNHPSHYLKEDEFQVMHVEQSALME